MSAALASSSVPPLEVLGDPQPPVVELELGVCAFHRDAALALTIPYLLLFLPKMWDHGELLFLALFALAALPRRVEAFAAVYLILSLTYFPLVQHLLGQALQGEVAPIQVHALLLFYPLLNLLAAVAILQSDEPPTTAALAPDSALP